MRGRRIVIFSRGSSVTKKPKEKAMDRRILIFALAPFALLSGGALAVAQQAGTAAEARAMLDRAVVALKANVAAALAAFNDKKNGDFHYRDLYVFCFDMTTGKFNAHVNSALIGRDSRTIKLGGDPLGQRVFDVIKNAPEGTVSTVDYIFPKPGTTEPVPKESYVTRIGDEGCGVGYYK
jgi:cytochrome c